MDILKTELLSVLEELKPLFEESQLNKPLIEGQVPDAADVLALFEKLELMLMNINPECVKLLDNIRAIPGTESLAQQIENYDFESAARTLVELKTNWEKNHV
jgi:hypothetical protein